MKTRAARWALLVCAILLIAVSRNPEAILQPALEAEDGTFLFPYLYAHRGISELLHFHNEYILVAHNFIAYVSVRLPTPSIAYGFAWLPLLLATVAYAWLFGSRFRPWLGGDATRAFICVLFVLAPLAQYHVYANTTYSIWTALLLIVLLVVTPPSPIVWRNIALWIGTNILVWSNPSTIVVAPLVLIRFVREPRARWLHALTLVNLVVYNVAGIDTGAIFAGLSVVEALGKIATSFGWTMAIVAGTAFRTVFGAPLFGWAEAGFSAPIIVWAIVVGAAIVVAAIQSRRLRPVLGVILYVSVAMTFVSVLGRGPSVLVPLNGAVRYIYTPTCAFIVMYVLLLEHFVIADRQRRRVIAYGAVTVLYLALNAQIGHYFVATGPAARPPGKASSPYVQATPGNGRIVREFFAELARIEAQKGSRADIRLKADKPGDWPIIADTRTPPRRR